MHGGDTITVANTMTEPVTGTFSLYYDDGNGMRQKLLDWEGRTLSPQGSDGASFDLSFSPPTDPKTPGKYLLVFVGTMGIEEGVVVGREITSPVFSLSTTSGDSEELDEGVFTFSHPGFSGSATIVKSGVGWQIAIRSSVASGTPVSSGTFGLESLVPLQIVSASGSASCSPAPARPLPSGGSLPVPPGIEACSFSSAPASCQAQTSGWHVIYFDYWEASAQIWAFAEKPDLPSAVNAGISAAAGATGGDSSACQATVNVSVQPY